MIVRFNGRMPKPQYFRLANQGNNKVDKVKFELPFFDGAEAFLHLKIGDYSDVVWLDDGVYTATRTHTQAAGRMEGGVEILAQDDLVWRSDVVAMSIGSIPEDGEQIEQQYPTAFEEARRAAGTLAGMDAKAETLEPGSEATVDFAEDENGNPVIVYGIPRGRDGEDCKCLSVPGEPGEDGGYYVPKVSGDGYLSWTPTKADMPNIATVNITGPAGKDGATGSTGKDGVSPVIAVTAIAGGSRVDITDVYGRKTVNVLDGQDGADGYSPTVNVESIDGGHRVTITDKNGAKNFDVLDANMADVEQMIEETILGGAW